MVRSLGWTRNELPLVLEAGRLRMLLLANAISIAITIRLLPGMSVFFQESIRLLVLRKKREEEDRIVDAERRLVMDGNSWTISSGLYQRFLSGF